MLLCLADGSADPDEFTPEAYAALLPEQTGLFYRSLGPLHSFRLIEQESNEKEQTYRYRAGFGETGWIQTFVLAPAGRIARVAVEPE